MLCCLRAAVLTERADICADRRARSDPRARARAPPGPSATCRARSAASSSAAPPPPPTAVGRNGPSGAHPQRACRPARRARSESSRATA